MILLLMKLDPCPIFPMFSFKIDSMHCNLIHPGSSWEHTHSLCSICETLCWTSFPSVGPCKSCGGKRLIATGKAGYKCENSDAGICLAGMDCVLKECLIHAKLQRCTQLEMLPYCKTPGCFQCLRSSRWFQQKSEIHESSNSWHMAVGRVKSICNTSVWLQEATRSSTDWQWSNGLRRLGMQTTHTSAKLLSPSIIYSQEHDWLWRIWWF